MKLIFIFLSTLCLASCGSGGGTSISNINNIEVESKYDHPYLKISEVAIFNNIDVESVIINPVSHNKYKKGLFTVSTNTKSFIIQLKAGKTSSVRFLTLIDPNGFEYIIEDDIHDFSLNKYFKQGWGSLSSLQFPVFSKNEVVAGEWEYTLASKHGISIVEVDLEVLLIERIHEISLRPTITVEPIISSDVFTSEEVLEGLELTKEFFNNYNISLEIDPTVTLIDSQKSITIGQSRVVADSEILLKGNKNKIRIFFVDKFSYQAYLQKDDEPLGLASGVPAFQGQSYNNYILINFFYLMNKDGSLDIEELSGALSHEIGHYLGLSHTIEKKGDQFDLLSDTLECDILKDSDGDGEVSAFECKDNGGYNLMFWGGSRGKHYMTPQQFFIIQHSPIVE
ncbi:MAG: hypothetical protein COA79_21700 [Planctomycetota bacterium]|nr:MAG: hypothetical protein COA79_21700 [Planctomycetota bacterium]